MSALNVAVLPDAVHVVTDGAAVGPDGRLLSLACKAWPVPHLRAVIAKRGHRGVGPLLADRLGAAAASFDDLRANVCSALRAALDELAPGFKARGLPRPDVDLVVAGWSESRGPDAYMICNHGKHGELLRPWTRLDLGGLMVTPEAPGLSARIVAMIDGGEPFERAALAMLEGQRAITGSECTLGFCAVGGFAQLTTVTRDMIATRILHRWPDRIGERISAEELEPA